MSTRAMVVGAGPAGLSAAMQLSTWCDSVTVVEAKPHRQLRQVGEHLPPKGLSALAAIGLDDLVADARHNPSVGVRYVWAGEQPVDKDYFMVLPGWGLNMRREVFHETLSARAEQQGASLRFNTRLAKLTSGPGGYCAALHSIEGSDNLRFDFVVDASGRRAVAARFLGAKRHRYDRLVGIVGQVSLREPIDDGGQLYIEAAKDGWWYGVQLATGTLLCAFMTDARSIRLHAHGLAHLWQDRLRASTLLGPLANITCVSGQLQLFDAATQLLERGPPANNFLAVGDAAMAFDPLSSWGIAKGLLDGHAGAIALARECGGQSGAVSQHRSRQRLEFEHYVEQHHEVYSAERRWPESPFWRKRREPLAYKRTNDENMATGSEHHAVGSNRM